MKILPSKVCLYFETSTQLIRSLERISQEQWAERVVHQKRFLEYLAIDNLRFSFQESRIEKLRRQNNVCRE